MPKTQQHTVAGSFASGVREGRKEAAAGDYHNAVIGVLLMAVIFLVTAYAFVKIVRWVLR